MKERVNEITNIIRLASVTIEENLRKKILAVLLFASLLLVASSGLINTFNLGVQMRILKDVALTAIGLFGIALTFSLFLTAIPGEMATRTIYPILAKPIGRTHYLWGKFLGLYSLVVLNLMILAVELFLMIWVLNESWIWTIFQAVFLMAIECGVVGAAVLMFSIYLTVPVNLSLSLFIYISGSMSSTYLKYMIETGSNPVTSILMRFVKLMLPNFDFFHIKNAVIHSYVISPGYVPSATLYGFIYILLFMLLTDLLFQRKDL
jgi:ABC-type transport system involved in multi-copper enzyme maturation permease subunit